jgi:prepilin-type N-terminal cleavage/methylation domain-containing protein
MQYSIRMQKVSGFTLVELMIAVAIVSLLSSIALPSLVRYTRRAKTVEATLNLRRMYDGAVAYYLGDHADKSGANQNQRFPNSAGPTPAAGIPRGTKKLTPPDEWRTPEWSALDFAVSDPQYYQYSFLNVGQGVGANAMGIVQAQGDLNGNGVPSTFQRVCMGEINGVMGGSAIYYVLSEIE